MDELSMLRAIVNSYPYPIVYVDDQYICLLYTSPSPRDI